MKKRLLKELVRQYQDQEIRSWKVDWIRDMTMWGNAFNLQLKIKTFQAKSDKDNTAMVLFLLYK